MPHSGHTMPNDLVELDARGNKTKRRTDYTLCWLLIAIAAFLLLTMPRFIYIGDPVTIRMTTIRLLTSGEISVPAEIAGGFGERGQFFFENPVGRVGQPHVNMVIAFTGKRLGQILSRGM